MGIPVKRYRRNTTLGDERSPKKYYLVQEPGRYKVITTEMIAKRMERKGTFRNLEVKHTIQCFIREMRNELVGGNRVKVDGLGTFHVTFATEGTVEEKDCTVESIKRVRVRFFADRALSLVNGSSAESSDNENGVQFYINSDGTAASDDVVNSDSQPFIEEKKRTRIKF